MKRLLAIILSISLTIGTMVSPVLAAEMTEKSDSVLENESQEINDTADSNLEENESSAEQEDSEKQFVEENADSNKDALEIDKDENNNDITEPDTTFPEEVPYGDELTEEESLDSVGDDTEQTEETQEAPIESITVNDIVRYTEEGWMASEQVYDEDTWTKLCDLEDRQERQI